MRLCRIAMAQMRVICHCEIFDTTLPYGAMWLGKDFTFFLQYGTNGSRLGMAWLYNCADVVDAVSSEGVANVVHFALHSTWTWSRREARTRQSGCLLLVVSWRSAFTVSRYVATPLQYHCCQLIFAFVIPVIKPTNVHLFLSTAAFIAIFISSYLPSATAAMGIVTLCFLGGHNLLRFQFEISTSIHCLWFESQLPLPSGYCWHHLCIIVVRFVQGCCI